jgi:hypothetical protein
LQSAYVLIIINSQHPRNDRPALLLSDGPSNATINFINETRWTNEGTQWWASSNVNKENDDMKKLLTTVVFLTIAATPVFAQSFAPEYGSGNIVSGTDQGGEGSYAQAPNSYETRYEHARQVRRLRPSAPKSEYNTKDESPE